MDHYANKISRFKLSLLHTYITPTVSMEYLEGRFIISTPFPGMNSTLHDNATRNSDPRSNVTVGENNVLQTDINEKSLKLHPSQNPKHLRHANITEMKNGNTNISFTPIGVNITKEIPDGVQGLGYYHVLDGVLTVFPDFCSFLVACTGNGLHSSEVSVVSTSALHELFHYYPNTENTTQSIGNRTSSKFLNSSSHSSSVNIAPHTSMTKVFTSDGREYFLVKDCVRFSFPDADTLISMGFSFLNAVGLRKKLLFMAPYGGMLEKMDQV